MSGVFQVDREIFDHGIWTNIAEFRIFLYILGKAIWKEEGTTIGGIYVARGQYLRSYRKLREDLMYIENNTVKHYSISTIQEKVGKFVKDGRLKTEETPLGTLFTVVNYSKYQGFDRFGKNNLEQLENGEGTEREQNKNNKKKSNKDKKDKKDNETLLQIKNLRLRYSESQLKTIDEYFDILRWTRKNGKIADSVILKVYTEWEKFHPDIVVHSLQIYINNPKYHDKKEQYCYGIMRNAKMEDVYKRGEDGNFKGNTGTRTNSGGTSEESIRLERIAKEQGLIGTDGSVGEIPEVDF